MDLYLLGNCCELAAALHGCALGTQHMSTSLKMVQETSSSAVACVDPATDAEHACRVHAASVLQMMHMLIHAGLMDDGVLEGITMFACYLSAIGEMEVWAVESFGAAQA